MEHVLPWSVLFSLFYDVSDNSYHLQEFTWWLDEMSRDVLGACQSECQVFLLILQLVIRNCGNLILASVRV